MARSAILTLVVVLVSACVSSPYAQFDDPNGEFDRRLETAFQLYIRLNPMKASQMDLSEDVAGGRYNDRIGEFGDTHVAASRALLETMSAELLSFDPSQLTDDRREHRRILTSRMAALLAMHDAAEAGGFLPLGRYGTPYAVSQVSGPHVDLPQSLVNYHKIESEDDVAAYITRMRRIGPYFDDVIEAMEINANAGVLPPDFSLDGAIEDIDRFVEPAADDNVLIKSLAQKLAESGVSEAEAYVLEAETVVRDIVYPAYARLRAVVTEHRKMATHDADARRFPNGVAYYDALVRVNADGEMTGEAIHQLGRSEVARIESEMDAILRSLGYLEGVAVERLVVLTADPKHTFAKPDADRAELLATVAPSVNGAKAVSGHHIQTVLAAQEADSPGLLRAYGSSMAHIEGWALYADYIAKEKGFFDDDPVGDLGRLQAEMRPAVGLVVDSGIHVKGWTPGTSDRLHDTENRNGSL